ncbi:hypothetical protein VTO73DRAFT_9802 [Trametes versicolor]
MNISPSHTRSSTRPRRESRSLSDVLAAQDAVGTIGHASRVASRLHRSIIALRTLVLRAARAPEKHARPRFDFSRGDRARLLNAVAPRAIPCVEAVTGQSVAHAVLSSAHALP